MSEQYFGQDWQDNWLDMFESYQEDEDYIALARLVRSFADNDIHLDPTIPDNVKRPAWDREHPDNW